jgi:hypothetical protein
VPQLYSLLEDAGLQLARFMDPLTYEPITYMHDAALKSRFDALEPRVRAEVAELLCGSMRKHSVYATHKPYVPFHPPPTGELLLALRPRLSPFFTWDSLEVPDPSGPNKVRVNERGLSDHYTRHFDFERWNLAILQECTGQRTALEIFKLMAVQAAIPGTNIEAKLNLFGSMLQQLAAQELVFCEL